MNESASKAQVQSPARAGGVGDGLLVSNSLGDIYATEKRDDDTIRSCRIMTNDHDHDMMTKTGIRKRNGEEETVNAKSSVLCLLQARGEVIVIQGRERISINENSHGTSNGRL